MYKFLLQNLFVALLHYCNIIVTLDNNNIRPNKTYNTFVLLKGKNFNINSG